MTKREQLRLRRSEKGNDHEIRVGDLDLSALPVQLAAEGAKA